MRKLALTIMGLFALSAFVYAGTEYSGKEMKQVAPAPCPEWYGDTEWNVALWGAYAFGGDDDSDVSSTSGSIGTGQSVGFDHIIGGDGAWGGGMDVKYFFHRYFGIGIEGFGLVNNRNLTPLERQIGFDDDDVVGAVKGTLTLRYPIHCSRFAPYIYVGGGALFWDRQRETRLPNESLARTDDDDPRPCGQVGGGLEVRITRHIGLITDVSWNFAEDDNFGMVRAGVNFAF